MKKLPKSLTKVTGFSKLVALFVILGFLASAFYAGVLFNQKYSLNTSSPVATEETTCSADSDCSLADITTGNLCCPNTRCTDYSKTNEQAYNSQWLQSEKFNQCKGRMCPMIAVICTKEITEENMHYSAKCISHVCTKIRN